VGTLFSTSPPRWLQAKYRLERGTRFKPRELADEVGAVHDDSGVEYWDQIH
jgi:hypothetical protein